MLRGCEGAGGSAATSSICRRGILGEVVLGHDLERLLEDLPELDGLIVGGEQVVRGVLAAAPFDLVDLLLYLERLEIIELGLMGLELGMELVFAGLLL